MMTVAELLDLEAAHPAPAITEAKRLAIRRAGTTPTRYYLALTRMLTDEALLAEAFQHDPTTTHRLLRQRDARAEARKARTRS